MASLWKHPKSKYWTACFTDHTGRQRKRSTKKTNRTDALTIALEFERTEQSARDGRLTQAQCRKVLSEILEKTTGESIRSLSAEQFLRSWIEGKETLRSAGTAERYGATVEQFIAHLGGKAKKPLDAISTGDVQSFLNARLKSGRAPKTVSVDAKALSGAFNKALSLGKVLVNPVKGADLPRVRSSKRTVFAHDQLISLLRVLDTPGGLAKVRLTTDEAFDWKSVVLLGFYTGARLRDCTNMLRPSLNLQTRTVEFEPQKTSESAPEDEDAKVVVPMHPDLEAHFSGLPARCQEHVCPTLAGRRTGGAHGLSAAFKRIMGAADIDCQSVQGKGTRQFSKLSFHSLRHSFNSLLANAGVDQETRMKLTGHKTESMNNGYTHHELSVLRTAISKLPSSNATG